LHELKKRRPRIAQGHSVVERVPSACSGL
jgi:hypothetical protein